MGGGFDLESENTARPTVFEGLGRIPEAGGGVLDFLENGGGATGRARARDRRLDGKHGGGSGFRFARGAFAG